MPLSYDVPLVTEDEIAKLAGLQGTENLESPELDRADLLLESHRAIYRELEARGVDPRRLTNEERLRSAVAFELVKRLALHGYLDPLNDRRASVELYQTQVERELRAFVPQYASGDAPRIDGVPAVANFEPGWAFGPTGTTPSPQRYWDDVPRSRRA